MNRVKGCPSNRLPWHRRAWRAFNLFATGRAKATSSLPCAVDEEILSIPSTVPEILGLVEMLFRVMDDDPTYSGPDGREKLEKYCAGLRDSQAHPSTLDRSTREAFAAKVYELLDRDPKLKS